MPLPAGTLTFSCLQCGCKTSKTFRSDVLIGAPDQCPCCGDKNLSVNRTSSTAWPLQVLGSLIDGLRNRNKIR